MPAVIQVPKGETIVGLVRRGMAAKLPNATLAAQLVGVTEPTYRFVNKLLTLQDREDLSREDQDLIEKALTKIETQRRLKEARTLVNGLLHRLWAPYTMNGDTKEHRRAQDKSRERLDKTLFLIREACANNEEMELPRLSAKERVAAIASLTESVAGLSYLIVKIQKGANE